MFSQTFAHGKSKNEIRQREVEVEKKRVNMVHERKKTWRPKQSKLKYNNYKHNLLPFYKIWKKYYEVQLTKNKMNLNNRIMKNHPPSPVSPHELDMQLIDDFYKVNFLNIK